MDDIASEAAGVVDEVAEISGRKHRSALDEHEMETDAQIRQATRDGDRIGALALADHQARSGKNAVAMGNRNRFVHLARQAEIVRGDDQSPQCTTSRLCRRKRKNSTASRSRFFITIGLRTISPTISAILSARK